MSLQLGLAAERLARDYLLKQGLVWRESNYRAQMGEIDLIMQDHDYLVFIEVRARRSDVFGGAVESITAFKRRKILHTAAAYVQRYRLQAQYMSRVDVLVLQGQPPTIDWIPNAFGADF